MQGEIDKSIIIVGDLNTPLSVMNRSRRQKIGKDIIDLNSTINELGLTDIHRILHPTTAEHTFLRLHGTFTKINHISPR